MMLLAYFALTVTSVSASCVHTITTVSGRAAPVEPLCSNQLIFNENFNNINSTIWSPVVTIKNGGEFEWYTAESKNSFIRHDILNIMPTLTTDDIPNLTKCNITITSGCTGTCSQVCDANNIAPPVKSARLTSSGGFQFKYGKIEIRAKLPTGDWLFPALWLMPQQSVYGNWPRSGEIDIMESRGNRNYKDGQGLTLGPEVVGSTLHFGTYSGNSAWRTAHYEKRSAAGKGHNNDYHLYQVEWTPDHIHFSIDGKTYGSVVTGEGFYKRGRFTGPNIWAKGGLNAPFDQEFYFILNTAIGGTSGFFPDDGNAAGGKPWKNNAQFPMRDFWNGRKQWIDTWNFHPSLPLTSALQVDYIHVRAL